MATAETYARAVWDTARRGEALPVAVARAISGKDDAKAAGGAWRAKPAAMRVFNLVARLNNENLKLSEIGLALVDQSDPDGQKRARRQAVLSVASYLKILKDHNGNTLPAQSAVATIFEFQYDVSTSAAKEAAAIFAESVKYAGLIDGNGNIKIDTSEVPAELEPQTSTASPSPKAPKAARPDPDAVLMPRTPAASPSGTGDESQNHSGAILAAPPARLVSGATTPVEVAVTIDMSKWDVADVLSVLNVLGYGDEPSGE